MAMTVADDDRRRIASSLSQLRRNVIRDFAFRIVRAFGDDDISLPQLATMLLLDEVGAQTIKGVAELLGRSLSATSRLLDHLVVRGLVDRREDEHDRRVKRVAITARGRQFIGARGDGPTHP
jgi:DNA-binding MarR family transcriptional regulator